MFSQENQRLKEQNDELNGQILSLSLYEAKNLCATQTKAQSLAAEIDNASRDEVIFITRRVMVKYVRKVYSAFHYVRALFQNELNLKKIPTEFRRHEIIFF